jgi:hypothetical protein
MNKLICIAALLLALGLSKKAFAEDPTIDVDTQKKSAVGAVLLMEWTQTRRIATTYPCTSTPGRTDCSYMLTDAGLDRPAIETSHPSVGAVNNYYAVSIAAHMAASYLPEKWKRPSAKYLGGQVEVELVSVRRNFISFMVRW